MFKTGFLIVVTLTAFVWFAATIDAQEKEKKTDKRDAEATEIAEQFVKAFMKEGDIEAVMKTVDVPFFFGGEGWEGEHIKDREEMRKNFDPLTASPKLEYKITTTYSFGSLPENFFSSHEHKLLGEILAKTDRIVIFRLPRSIMAVAVRCQKGEAKAVGVHSHLSPFVLTIVALEKDKGDKRVMQARKIAQETVQQVLTAAKAEDLENLVKLTDVPWYADGNKIIKDRDELNKSLKRGWVDRARSARFQPKVLGLIRHGELGDLYGGERLRADEVLGKEDWVVFIGQNGNPMGFLFVRLREGKGKVVGAGQ